MGRSKDGGLAESGQCLGQYRVLNEGAIVIIHSKGRPTQCLDLYLWKSIKVVEQKYGPKELVV